MTKAETAATGVSTAVGEVRFPDATAAAQPAPGQPVPLKQLAIRGATWTIAGYGASQVLRLGSNLILTRLLFPEAFGLMALVSVVLQGLQMFSDVGLRPSIICSQRGDDPAFVNVAWTLQIIRGVALWLICCALAWPVAAFYDAPILRILLPVSGLTAVIAGLNSTSLVLANRQMRFERITVVELMSQIVAIAAMIGWAVLSPSVWALVVGGLVGAAVRMALSYAFVPGVPCRLRWSRECLTELITFGRWIFASTALTFLVNQGDRLLFGKLLSMEMLGVYSIAVTLTMVPKQIIARISDSVAMPTYSAILRRGEGLAATFQRVRLPLTVLAGAATSVFIATGPCLIDVLYDPRYAAAGWMLQIVGVGLIFQVLEATNGSALLAAGHAKAVAAASAAKLVGMVVLLPVGWWLAELPGALCGLVAAEVAKWAASSIALRTIQVGSLWRDGSALMRTAVAGVLGYLLCAQLTATVGLAGALPAGLSGALLPWLPAVRAANHFMRRRTT
jgi:O-antigen/teichoic acid export membrane protein